MAKVLMIRLMKRSGPLDEDGGDESLFEHKAVARNLPAFDQVAHNAGLPRLSDFLSEDPENVYDLVDDEDEAEELLAKLPKVRWFDPADALPTVAALIAGMEDGESIAGIKNPAKVITELRNIETVLQYGASKRATFWFYQDF